MHLRPKLLLPLIVVLAGLLISNSSNPPNARTGAPGEQLCSGCHGGGSYSGTVEIDGLPSTVTAGETYTITLTTTATSGNPLTGGFQIVALNSSNQNVGDLIVINGAETGTETSGGREYMEHRGDKSYSGNTVSWTFDWTAPNGPNNAALKMYFSSVLANNNSGSSGDVAVNSNFSFTLQAPTPPSVVITNTQNVSCAGEQDGALTASASGGTPPYTYAWSNGQSGPTASNLGAGNYTVTVTDNAGQTASSQGTVSQPSPVTVFQVTAEPLTCIAPAQVTVGASGGSPGYEYAWSSGGNQATENLELSDLPATVTVTDNNGCTGTFTVNSVPLNTTAPTVSVQGGSITCSSPVVTLGTAGSSQGNVSFAWNGPNGFASMMQNPQAIEPGNYILVVTDLDNGCTASATATVTEDITAPLISLPQTDSLHCNRTVTEIMAPAFAGGASYSWSTADGQIVYGGNAATVGAGKPGTYSLIVTLNSNGCTGSQNAIVAAYPDPELTLDSFLAVNCNLGSDGYAAWTAAGGLAPFAYLWPDSSSASTRADLPAGTYLVTLTDQHGCTDSESVVITQPSPLVSGITATGETAPGANDGTASSTPTGGTGPYTFLWSNGSNQPTITGLPPGAYMVTITDAAGCTGIGTASVQPFGCSLIASYSVTPANCAMQEGYAVVTVQNSNGAVSIQWSNGIQGDTLFALAGVYGFVVTDDKGCVAQDTAIITEPSAIAIQLDSLFQPTPGSNDGAIHISPYGGTAPYSFLWTNSEGNTVSTSEDLGGVPCGRYSLLITDNAGCQDSLFVELCTSASQPAWVGQVKLFPVPACDWLQVELPGGSGYRVELWDFTGRSVSTRTEQAGILRIEMFGTPSGVYLLVITDSAGHRATYAINK